MEEKVAVHDPDRSSALHRLANRIVFNHAMDLADKYDKLGRYENKKGSPDKAIESHLEAQSIRRWLFDKE